MRKPAGAAVGAARNGQGAPPGPAPGEFPPFRVLDPSEPDTASGFLQSAFWGAFKARSGWKAFRIFPLEGNGKGNPILVLERRLGAGYTFAYVPHGPEVPPDPDKPDAGLGALAFALRPHLSRRCLFVRFDLPWHEAAGSPPRGAFAPDASSGLVRGTPVQVPDTVLLDLAPEPDVLLAAMKPKWRYNIRLAEKKGVTVSREGAGSLPLFYGLYTKTAERDRIALHPESYYAALFETAGAAGAGAHPVTLDLWVARHEGRAIAAIITLFRGDRAVYLYGASSDEKRSLMPAYALQWHAILAAREAGCREYDFFGIPPDDDPAHPMAGLYRFKTGFGGAVAHRAGAWDAPLAPLPYAAFRAAESIRNWWFKRVRKAGRPRGGGS